MGCSASCDALFEGIGFYPMRSADPPARKGVYFIRYTARGLDPDAMIHTVDGIIERIDWHVVTGKAGNRLERLRKINDCPVLYIGGAGVSPRSRNTLKHRYSEFSGRHTAMYPIWTLLYFGWELEFGWQAGEDSGQMEAEWKQRYRDLHGGVLPALVAR